MLSNALARTNRVVSRTLSSTATSSKAHDLFKMGDTMGRLSDSPETNLVPTLVEGFSDHRITQVSSSWMHTLVTCDNGYLYAWGYNEFGQLGMPNRQIRSINVPDWIDALQAVKVKKAAAGRSHSVVVTDEGKVIIWGGQEFGQLGDGIVEKTSHEAPKRVETIYNKTIVDVVCGLDHTIVLTDEGELYGWGYNYESQLGCGDDALDVIPTPTRIPGIDKKVVKVYSGMDYAMALTDDGKFYAWGLGEMWQFANGERDLKSLPILSEIPGEKVTDLSLGGISVIALTGNVYSWGMGSNGRLGVGDDEDKPWPTPIPAFGEYQKKIVQIAGRGGHHLALSDDGVPYSWGLGRNGRLGHGDEQDHYLPLPIDGLKDKKVVSVAAGLDCSFAVSTYRADIALKKRGGRACAGYMP